MTNQLHLDSFDSYSAQLRQAVPDAKGEKMNPHMKHILIAEDDPVIRELLAIALEDFGHIVRVAEDGISALEQIGIDAPDVLLSDLNMPRMDGYELLSTVRERYPYMGLVAMSGAHIGQAVPSGVAADAFYAKGSDPALLFGLLKAFPIKHQLPGFLK